MEVNAEGRPTKPKMSQLTVASDKAHGILGTCELDISKFGADDFEVHTLELKDAQFENSVVEVWLKGAEKRAKSTKNATPSNQDPAIVSSIMALEEDIEKLMKEQKQNQMDQKKQID